MPGRKNIISSASAPTVDRASHERLAAAVETFAAGLALSPPVPLETLSAAVDDFLRTRIGFEDIADLRERALILLHNALWRDAVMAVPPARRLLLLPQCLRRLDACQATVDELGYACAGCGQCPVAGHIEAAERAGLMVMVAEGSAFAAQAARFEEVGAVIGICCLDALEKAFPAIDAAALPALAIPLDGCPHCRDATVDHEAVRSAIALEHAGRDIDLAWVRSHAESLFTPGRLESFCGPPESESEALARAYVAERGKRHRPRLLLAAYQALAAAEGVPEWVERAAVAVEFFHKASLIHDDIEDGDDFRDGAPALHRRHGPAMALNMGDLLLGEGYRLLAGLAEAREAARLELLLTAATLQRGLCLGQGREFEWLRGQEKPGNEDVFRIAAEKTGKAFEAALAFGLICAEAYAPLRVFAADFCARLGVAYQLRDDLADAAEAPDKEVCPGPLSFVSVMGRDAALEGYRAEREALRALLRGLAPPRLKLLLFQLVGKVLPDIS